ncbi:hypothetical protein K3N28_21320 [Glycomyces sp. TRM65418]|uniref:hypothetical protein n=1 Tax=Glycomyces sp. TRM65418 TaxID=2867006 RepID=UPI001CE5511F|nr:hypothetical protein [Glycomyces sp. TRM65418]MCC3765603.1 hypothetical protein [Glycomyces sp. TRM65418]QZD55204.1 hypothetical protein K3N28_21210 [Glycomyces sp. TRM65418]
MAIMLPSELAGLLGVLGFDWPQSNEDNLMDFGQVWMDFGSELSEIAGEAGGNAAQAWTDQIGKDIDAFKTWWESEDGPASILDSGSIGAMIGGVGLIICSIIVLVLKIMVIVQLVILAVQIAIAIAQAAVTFGASLLQVPIFQQLARTVVGNLIQEAIFKLMEA